MQLHKKIVSFIYLVVFIYKTNRLKFHVFHFHDIKYGYGLQIVY